MHGQRYCSHAQACGFLRKCHPNSQGRRSRERQEDENLGEGDFTRQARDCPGWLRKVPRDLVCTPALQANPFSDTCLRIPLERGQELAQRYGVAPLLSPLFDFVPTTSSGNTMASMTSQTQSTQSAPTPRPLSASSSFSSMGATNSYGPGSLGPAPIMPGSAMRLLNQGRAQGLFTPSTSIPPSRQSIHASPPPAHNSTTGYSTSNSYVPTALPPTPSTSSQQLKRTRSDMEGDVMTPRMVAPLQAVPQQSNQTNSTSENNFSRPSSSTLVLNGDDNPPPAKRSRKELATTNSVDGQDATPTRPGSRNSITMEGLCCPRHLHPLSLIIDCPITPS